MNKAQQRARNKHTEDKASRRKAERTRTIRAAVTTVAVLALALVVTLVIRSGDDKKTGAAASNKPSGSAAGGPAACGGKARGAYKPKKYGAPPKQTIDTAKTYTATLETSCGTIEVKLFDDKAPKTVNNFVTLARDGFYNNSIFHRVIKGFMIQGGDPLSTGTGDPGYKFEDETRPDDSFDKPGILAMANSGPDTNGSQFFITEVPTPHLNGRHTIFGEVTKGLEVVQKIVNVEKGGQDRPAKDVVLYKVTIAES